MRRREQGRRSALIVVQNLSVPLDRRVWQEACALRDAAWSVAVICPRESDEPRRRVLDGIRVYTYAPAPPARGVGGFVREFAESWLKTAALSVRAWRDERFTVLQACNPPDTYWLLARLWSVLGVRFLFDQHDLCPEVYEDRFGKRNVLYRMLLRLELATYRSAHALVSSNESYREVAHLRGGWPVEKVHVVRSAPDPDTMNAGPSEPDLRRGQRHLVVYLGVMGPQDGVDRLVLAMRSMRDDLGRDDVQLALLGFGDCEAELRQLVTDVDLDDRVEFVGRADTATIRRWLSSADVGVSPDPPSDFNSRSTMNKVLEYMAHGLATVMYDLTENRRSAGPDAALVVHDASPQALGRAISELLDDGPRRKLMGAAGRHRIETEMRWDAQARTYVEAMEAARVRTRRRGRDHR